MTEEQTCAWALRFVEMEIAGEIVWAPRDKDDVAYAKRVRRRLIYQQRRLQRLAAAAPVSTEPVEGGA